MSCGAATLRLRRRTPPTSSSRRTRATPSLPKRTWPRRAPPPPRLRLWCVRVCLLVAVRTWRSHRFVPQRALSATNLRATALNALCGMLGDAAEELAPLDPAAEAAVAAAAAEAGVGPAWVAAARAHRIAQAEIVGAGCRAVDSWLTAMAREANNRKRARAMAAERAAAPPAAAAEA